jgi:hypothetical protein
MAHSGLGLGFLGLSFICFFESADDGPMRAAVTRKIRNTQDTRVRMILLIIVATRSGVSSLENIFGYP